MFSRARVGQCLTSPTRIQVPVSRCRGQTLPLYKISQHPRQIHSTTQRPYTATSKHPTSQKSARTITTLRPLSTQTMSTPSQEQHFIKSTTPTEPTIHALFEPNTSTWQYIVVDPSSSEGVIIDPVLDYDRTTQTITTSSADGILKIVKEKGYKIAMILETHIHADHVTAASYLQGQLAQSRFQGFQPPIGIGKRIEQVQTLFGGRYGVAEAEYRGIFGKYFDDDEGFKIGGLDASVLHLPGHTPDHVGYRIGGEYLLLNTSLIRAAQYSH